MTMKEQLIQDLQKIYPSSMWKSIARKSIASLQSMLENAKHMDKLWEVCKK